MSTYNGRKFATEFSKRTQANMEYIEWVVNAEKDSAETVDGFIEKLDKTIQDVDDLKNRIREEAIKVSNARKNDVKRTLNAVADRLEEGKKDLDRKLRELVSPLKAAEYKPYEVTQLLNSLVGIVVLPYEMYKDIFKGKDHKSTEKLNKIIGSEEYRDFQKYIMSLYRSGKWNSTYSDDKDQEGNVNEKKIVISFLKHIRNAICHSGDDGALSVFPLDDGTIITDVIFYDRKKPHNQSDESLDSQSTNNQKEEFALKLSVRKERPEVQEMIKKIANFYRMHELRQIDKTEEIQKAETRAWRILNE